MPITLPTASANRQNLARLTLLRCLVLSLQSGAAVTFFLLDILPLPWVPIIIVFSVSATLCLLTSIRLWLFWPVTEQEYAIQLATDLLLHSLILYFSGGATNPFVSYYLIPVVIAATTLRWYYTLLLAGLAITAYTVLLVWFYPLHITGLPYEAFLIQLHVFGMWGNFAMSAILISFFVVRMTEALRRQDRYIARRREDDLRAQQLLAVATQAAGAAHELSTPLSTMSVLLTEMRRERPDDPLLQEDAAILQEQVRLCKESLRQLVRAAEADRQQEIVIQPIVAWLDQVLQRWHLMRPEASYRYRREGQEPIPTVPTPPDLTQALINLLNNAADACPDNLDITLDWNAQEATLHIRDHGHGIEPEVAERLGTPFLSTKDKKGFGLGLFLSQVSVNRAGGIIRLHAHEGGGTLTEVRLTLHERPNHER